MEILQILASQQSTPPLPHLAQPISFPALQIPQLGQGKALCIVSSSTKGVNLVSSHPLCTNMQIINISIEQAGIAQSCWDF